MSEGGVLSASRLSSSLVSWEVAEDSDEKVGIITLRSPKTYNALTVEMGREFEALVSSLESDLAGKNNANSQIGAIVLRGEGDKAFSAGGDLEWLRSLSQNSVHANVDAMLSFYNSFLCMREKLPVPVIASLHGPAVGAGACLALACDLRVGASGGVPLLGFPFARLGIPSGMGALHLLQNCSGLGSSRISEIMMLGKTLTGEEAFDLGLLNRIVPRDDVEEEAISLALELVRTSHPLAVRSLVRSIRLGTNNGGGGSGLADCLYRDAHAQAMCYNRRDWGEGLEAVACKRDPNFDDYHCK
jgi:enoyl-CoA hydratase/carnithine racemase